MQNFKSYFTIFFEMYEFKACCILIGMPNMRAATVRYESDRKTRGYESTTNGRNIKPSQIWPL